MLRGRPTVMGSRPASSISTVRVYSPGSKSDRFSSTALNTVPRTSGAGIFIGHDDRLVGLQKAQELPQSPGKTGSTAAHPDPDAGRLTHPEPVELPGHLEGVTRFDPHGRKGRGKSFIQRRRNLSASLEDQQVRDGCEPRNDRILPEAVPLPPRLLRVGAVSFQADDVMPVGGLELEGALRPLPPDLVLFAALGVDEEEPRLDILPGHLTNKRDRYLTHGTERVGAPLLV